MYRYGYTRTRKHERERTPCNRRAHTPRVARTSMHCQCVFVQAHWYTQAWRMHNTGPYRDSCQRDSCPVHWEAAAHSPCSCLHECKHLGMTADRMCASTHMRVRARI